MPSCSTRHRHSCCSRTRSLRRTFDRCPSWALNSCRHYHTSWWHCRIARQRAHCLGRAPRPCRRHRQCSAARSRWAENHDRSYRLGRRWCRRWRRPPGWYTPSPRQHRRDRRHHRPPCSRRCRRSPSPGTCPAHNRHWKCRPRPGWRGSLPAARCSPTYRTRAPLPTGRRRSAESWSQSTGSPRSRTRGPARRRPSYRTPRSRRTAASNTRSGRQQWPRRPHFDIASWSYTRPAAAAWVDCSCRRRHTGPWRYTPGRPAAVEIRYTPLRRWRTVRHCNDWSPPWQDRRFGTGRWGIRSRRRPRRPRCSRIRCPAPSSACSRYHTLRYNKPGSHPRSPGRIPRRTRCPTRTPGRRNVDSHRARRCSPTWRSPSAFATRRPRSSGAGHPNSVWPLRYRARRARSCCRPRCTPRSVCRFARNTRSCHPRWPNSSRIHTRRAPNRRRPPAANSRRRRNDRLPPRAPRASTCTGNRRGSDSPRPGQRQECPRSFDRDRPRGSPPADRSAGWAVRGPRYSPGLHSRR